MFTKYDLLSYFLSIFINIFFLLIFFSTLNFSIHTEEKVRVRLISKVNFVSSLSPASVKSSPKSKTKNISKKKEIKRKRTTKRKTIQKKQISEEEILKERLAKIKSKVSKNESKENSSEYSLSEEELKQLKKKILAFQKNEVSQGTSSDETLGLEYLLLIKRKLQNNFEVPIYLRNQKDLYAIVKIKISSQGQILYYEFLKKSTSSEFNRAVEKCLKVSSPLPINKSVKIVVEFKGEGIGKIR